MNYFNRNKWLAIAFLLLIALNIATLTAFWLMRGKRPALTERTSNVVEFMVRELGFDSAQKQKLIALNAQHRQQMFEVRNGNRETKDAFFALLKQQDIADSTLQRAARASVKYDEETVILTFKHFQQVRALCYTQQQKEKFDNIIEEVLHSNAPPPPGQHPGPPPEGMHDGPPPGDRRPPE